MSRLIRFSQIVAACALVLSTASLAGAQSITANGSSGPLAIYAGDQVAIAATGSGHVRDWVGLYAVGSPSGYPYYRDWYYLNGTKTLPSSPVGAAAFPFAVAQNPGTYEFRLHRGDTYAVIATTGVVTMQPPAINVNGVVAPDTVMSGPGAGIQVNVFGGPGNNDWVGLYRVGAADHLWTDWMFLNGTRSLTGSPIRTASLTMTLPLARGPYEARWFYGNSYTRFATSPLIQSEVSTIAASGAAHTLVVRQGTVWSAGLNASGQLGVGSTTNQALPAQIAGLSDVVSVAAGAAHSLAITASGALYTWGANDAGQLGDDSTTPQTAPIQLSLTEVVAIAAGEQHSVALTATGQLYTWGLNASGQLGQGSTTDSAVPIQVATGVLAIGAGDHFTVFVKADGTVWGMGDNAFGALGDTTGTMRTSPVQMSGITNAMAVAGGHQHAVILLADGTVRATGRNHLGQRGAASAPTWTANAVALSNIAAIAAGDDFSLALATDGTVWAWGDNGAGQLGVETPSSRATPESIAGLSGIRFIAAGAASSIAINANGVVMAFGANGSGQLGDGTTTGRATPAVSDGFSERLATPTFSIAAGTYTNDFDVIVSHAIAGSTLHYTQNGSEPTESDATIASGASVSIEHSQTLRVKAWKSGWLPSAVGAAAYELKAAAPSLSPPAGTFGSPTSVTLSTSTPGAIVRYTVDGSAPTASSPQFLAPVSISTTTTLRAAAFKMNWSASDVTDGAYAMHFGTLGSPSVEPATGTYVGGTTVTMSSAQPGAVVRFTTNGETPTTGSAVYTAPIAVDGPMTVKAMAFHPDYTASAETDRTYAIAAAPPTISPATGTYASEQSVTMSAAAGPAVTIRYTTDGTEPTESSAAYAAPFPIATGTAVKARAFPSNGWSASAVASATLSFDYGPLAAPTVSPEGGVYADAQSVSLSALPGATIRYTTDGSEPTAVSNVYMAPLSVSGDLVIKARAFHGDWTPSPVMSADYTIDATAPTITSSRFPAAIDGWHNTATTISFSCQDNVGIASCSAPITVASEGAGQQIAGTAVDEAGREATETVTVNLDATAPTVTITAPAASLTTANSSIDLEGEVSDSLSGVVEATCNGAPATVVAGVVSCAVPLGPGRNDIVLAARDAAGNVASKGVRIIRVGTATALGLTPTAKTLVLDEATTLTLTDEFGAVVAAATWSSSEPSIVAVSTDDPPVLTALQAGSATITASKNGLSAQATLTVAAGASLPYGTTRWSISGGPLSAVGYTIAANRVELSVPDLFSIETAGNDTIVRGITASGDVLWTQSSPGTPIMGDSFGGLVAGTPASAVTYSAFSHAAFTRFGGPADALPWRYEATGELARPAQSPDGTIYVLERRVLSLQANNAPITDTKLVVLDGETGAVRARLPVAPNRKGLSCGVNGTWEEPATVWGPVVGNDGYGYLLVATSTHVRSGPCPHHYSQDRALTQWRIAPSGAMTPTVIFSEHCERAPGQITTCDAGAASYVHGIVGDTADFLPDGVGGMLVRWRRVMSVSGDPNAPHTLSFTSEPRLSRVVDGAVDYDIVVGENEHTQLIGGGGTAYVASLNGWRAMDVATWTPIWSNTNLGLEPVAALANGGVAMHDLNTGMMHQIDAAGGSLTSGAFGGRWGYQSSLGNWTFVESNNGLVSRVSLPLVEGTMSFSLFGIGDGQNAPRAPRFVQFVVPQELLLPTSPLGSYTAADYRTDFNREIRERRIRGEAAFFNGPEAESDTFLFEAVKKVDALAFVGHSVTISGIGSVGLTFGDGMSIIKKSSPQYEGPNGILFTKPLEVINSAAKVIFIAACDTRPLFESLWDIGAATSGRALILPVDDRVDLYYASQAWFFIAGSLSQGKTVAAAVTDGNDFLAAENRQLRFKVVGDANATIR